MASPPVRASIGTACLLLLIAAVVPAACRRAAFGDAVRDSVPPAFARAAREAPRVAAQQQAGVRRPWPARVGRLLLVAAAAVGLFLALALLMEGRFIFFPSRDPDGAWEPLGASAEQCFFRTADGLKLHGWWYPGHGPGNPSERPVLLWCHGNAGNITHRASNFAMLAGRGLAVLLFDYRGYGLSEGKPSEPGLYLDVEAAYRYLVEDRGIAPHRIVCYGRSLGAAVALHAALGRDVAGVVLESPFASIPAMARLDPVLRPLAGLVRNRFDNLARIGRLDRPLLVIQAERDEVVPAEQGRAVFDAARSDKQLHVVAGARHNDVCETAGEDYWRVLTDFCIRCVKGRGG